MAAGLLLATACEPTPPASGQPVPGVVITTRTGHGTIPISIQMTTARSLTVSCNSAGTITVNGTALANVCANADILEVVGSAGNDTVTLDLRAFPRGGYAKLGDGNDTATLRHRGDNSGRLWGEGGNDTLSSGFDPGASYAGGDTGEWSEPRDLLDGGPGNDKLTDLGFLTTPILGTDEQLMGLGLTGGPGADTLVSAANRPETASIDLDDAPWKAGTNIRFVALATRATAETVLIHNDGNWGTEVTVDGAGAQAHLVLPDKLPALRVSTGAGADQVTIDHKSYSTKLSVFGDTGANTLSLRPRSPYTWDQAEGIVTQPGAQQWNYEASAFRGRTTLTPM